MLVPLFFSIQLGLQSLSLVQNQKREFIKVHSCRGEACEHKSYERRDSCPLPLSVTYSILRSLCSSQGSSSFPYGRCEAVCGLPVGFRCVAVSYRFRPTSKFVYSIILSL